MRLSAAIIIALTLRGVRQGGGEAEGDNELKGAQPLSIKQQHQTSLPRPPWPENDSFINAFSTQLLSVQGLELFPEKGSPAYQSYTLLSALSFHSKTIQGTAVRELVLAFISACSKVESKELQNSALETVLSQSWQDKAWRQSTGVCLSFSQLLVTLLAVKYPLDVALEIYGRLGKYQGVGMAKEVSHTLLEIVSANRDFPTLPGAQRTAIITYIQRRCEKCARTDEFACQLTEGLRILAGDDDNPLVRLRKSIEEIKSPNDNTYQYLLTAVNFALQPKPDVEASYGSSKVLAKVLLAFGCNPSKADISMPEPIRRLMVAAAIHLAIPAQAGAALSASPAAAGPAADRTLQGTAMTADSASSSATFDGNSQVPVPFTRKPPGAPRRPRCNRLMRICFKCNSIELFLLEIISPCRLVTTILTLK